jgi:hypothetical protein
MLDIYFVYTYMIQVPEFQLYRTLLVFLIKDNITFAGIGITSCVGGHYFLMHGQLDLPRMDKR